MGVKKSEIGTVIGQEAVPVDLSEQATPGVLANIHRLYAKDVSGIAELFTQDDAGNEIQITSGGSIAGGGAPIDIGVSLDSITDQTTLDAAPSILKIDRVTNVIPGFSKGPLVVLSYVFANDPCIWAMKYQITMLPPDGPSYYPCYKSGGAMGRMSVGVSTLTATATYYEEMDGYRISITKNKGKGGNIEIEVQSQSSGAATVDLFCEMSIIEYQPSGPI